MDALLKGLWQRAIWCLLCQPGDGAPTWLDEDETERSDENQADQPDGDPAGPEAPGGDCHVEPAGEDEQHADDEEGTQSPGEVGERPHLFDAPRSTQRSEADQPGAYADKVADGSADMQKENDVIDIHAYPPV